MNSSNLKSSAEKENYLTGLWSLPYQIFYFLHVKFIVKHFAENSKKIFFLCCVVLLFHSKCIAQTAYGPYIYASGNDSLSITVGYISNLWTGSDGVTITIKNIGSTSIEMKNATLVFKTSIVPTFNTFTSLGNLSWPYFSLPPRDIIDAASPEILEDTIMKYQSGDAWSITKLTANQSFTAEYYFANTTVSTSFIQSFSQALRFYPASWPQPVFYAPVTFNFTDNGGNHATVHVLNNSTAASGSYTIASGVSESLLAGSSFSIWADNFIVGSTQYISQYTSSAPYSLSTSANGAGTSVTLPFSTTAIPTGNIPLVVTGLPMGSKVNVTLAGSKYNTSNSCQVGNGTILLTGLPLDTFTVTAVKYVNDTTNIVAKGTYNSQYILSATTGDTLKIAYTSGKIIPFAIRGFPKYIAHGGITIDSTDSTFTRTPMNVLFKYSGSAGDGDPGCLWDSVPNIQSAIVNTIAQCRSLETTYKSMYSFLPSDFTVLPVMVHYTANASGTWSVALVELLDTTHLRYQLINLIRETQVFMKNQDATHPYPGSFILSPDFLGMLEQEYSLITAEPAFDYDNPSSFGDTSSGYNANIFASKVFVNEKMAEAFRWCGLDPSTLPVFTDDIKGYFQALTYIVHAVSNNSVTVGYQENMWATGSAQWVTEHTADPKTQGQAVVNFVNTNLGIFNGTYKPDYFVLDRYEMDDFGGGIGNYCYNATSWREVLTYGSTIASGFGTRWMLWQYPGGHLVPANGSEPVTNYMSVTHGGAGGDFIFGDSNIGSNLNNISTTQLDISITPSTYLGASTVGGLFALDNGYNWSKSQLDSLSAINVFAILWGGGNTTSITHCAGNGDDDGWLAKRVKSYLNGNQTFETNSTGLESASSYSVTSTANPAAGGVVTGSGIYTSGSSCKVTVKANLGYIFTNWTDEYGNQISTDSSYTFTVSAMHTMTANFSTASIYSVAVSASPSTGGAVSGGGSFTSGSPCTVIAKANTGYTFTNWTKNGTVVAADSSYTFAVDAASTLVANFDIVTNVKTIYSDGNNQLSIYPSPTTGNISIGIPGTDAEVTVAIISMSGVAQLNQNLTVPQNRVVNINGSSLPNGTYIVNVNGTTIHGLIKIVKE